MTFNSSQEKAIRHFRGPCMVLAGPGSGKTTVLTHRIRCLTGQYGVEPGKILLITFTRAAAEEMAQRYRALMGDTGGSPVFATFHSLFFRMLQVSGRCSRDSLLPDGARRTVLEGIFSDSFPDTEPEPELLNLLLSEISRVKNSHGDPETFPSVNGRVPFPEVYRLYRIAMKKAGKIDFDDMLLLAYELLTKDRSSLEYWRDRFPFIMVDEFQDINRLQYDILKLLAKPLNNLFIVGDDDQSIYGFRGSRPELMLRFPEEWPGTEVIRLSVNYRSGGEIVRQSVKLIENNRERYRKHLKAEDRAGGTVFIRRFEEEEQMYGYITETILRELQSGRNPERIACLSRTKEGLSVLLTRLLEKQIPFYTRDIVPNPYTHYICKPLFAFLNFVNGSHTRRNFLKFMNCPVRYFRREDIRTELVEPALLPKLYETDEKRYYMKERAEYLAYQIRFCEHLKYPFSIINYFRKVMEYDRYAETLCAERGADPGTLLAVLDEVQESAAPFRTVDDWYTRVEVCTRALDEQQRNGRRHSGKVAVSSLHGVKGLEYETVFILNCTEGTIPHRKALTEADLEEERRLLYVGMTRAKENLHLLHAGERCGRKMEISRFIRELE